MSVIKLISVPPSHFTFPRRFESFTSAVLQQLFRKSLRSGSHWARIRVELQRCSRTSHFVITSTNLYHIIAANVCYLRKKNGGENTHLHCGDLNQILRTETASLWWIHITIKSPFNGSRIWWHQWSFQNHALSHWILNCMSVTRR